MLDDPSPLLRVTPVEAAMEAVTAAAGDMAGPRPPALAARYAALAPLLEAEGRWAEAAIAWQGASIGVADPGPAIAAAYRAGARAERHGSLFEEHANWLGERERHAEFPAHVSLETLASCNAACLFCPYPEIERQGSRMPDALLDRLMGNLADIPRDRRFNLSFHHMSEPFLDRRFAGLLQRAERDLPNARLVLVTNGTALNAANIAMLGGIGTIGELNISFNDHRPSEYEATMRLPHARTLGNIDALHDAALLGSHRAPTIIRRVGDGSAADRDFLRFCRDRWPLFRTTSKRAKDFLGQIALGPGGRPIAEVVHGGTAVVGCNQWSHMTITAEGKVAVCCFDGKVERSIAELGERHLLEVYNAPEMRRFRERSFTRLEAPQPCASCSIFWGGRQMNMVG